MENEMFPNYKEFHLSPFFMLEANRDGSQGGAGDATQNNSQNDNQNQQPNTPQDFTTWLEGQSDDLKKAAKPLFEAHVKALKSSLTAAREERDDFSKQLRTATSKMKADSDERKELEGIADKLEAANQRADFFEEAVENNCHNPRAAFAIAKADNLFTKSGAPDWKKIQDAVPEFFVPKKKVITKRTGGEGANGQPTTGADMNSWIRRQAGRGTVITE